MINIANTLPHNRRKIQLTGTSTYVVSLPKSWARKNGVSAGREAIIAETPDGSLSLRLDEPPKNKKEIKINMDALKNQPEIHRFLLSAYLGGFASIKFFSSAKISPQTSILLSSEVKRLPGFQITEEKDNEITIQDFFSPNNLSIEKTVRRAHTFSFKMHEDLAECLFEGGQAHRSIIEMDKEVDSLSFLVLRQATEALSDSSRMQAFGMLPHECVHFILLMRNIEKIGDYARTSAEKLSKEKAKMLPKDAEPLHSLHSLALCAYSEAVGAFLESDAAQANKVLMKISQGITDAKQPNPHAPHNFIYDGIFRTMERSSAIAQLAITRSIQKNSQ